MKSRFIHTSASISDGLYPSDIKVSYIFALYAAPEFLIPYSALDNITAPIFSVTNSVSASVQFCVNDVIVINIMNNFTGLQHIGFNGFAKRHWQTGY